jgi:EAL domain-containing protein (putative c-di-GMP-specific phosphodiesterase class I)
MRRGLQEVRKWCKYNPEFYLSVNLSVIHFEQDCIVDDITSLLLELDLPAAIFKLEVTGSALMKYPEKAIETMRKFEDLGIKLALDDFGTGYYSFAYLKQQPLEEVKLDRSFTWGIGKEQKDETIIEAILGGAANLGIKVIAEGI